MELRLDDPLAFIALRNYDAFQYTEAGRPRKSGDRRRWGRLHLSLLTSDDWIMSDPPTKLMLVTLIALSTQYQNRVPNSHQYLASVTGLSESQVFESLESLYRAGNRGFIELTLDPTPDEELTVKPKSKPKPKGADKRFDDFWAVYPNRKDKKLARQRWITNKLDKHADEIIAAVKVQADSHDWTKENGRFIPLPSTYLNKERWKDEETTAHTPRGEGAVGTIDADRWY